MVRPSSSDVHTGAGRLRYRGWQTDNNNNKLQTSPKPSNLRWVDFVRFLTIWDPWGRGVKLEAVSLIFITVRMNTEASMCLPGARRGRKRLANTLGLELQRVGVIVWVLRTEPGTSSRATSTFHRWANSPDLCESFYKSWISLWAFLLTLFGYLFIQRFSESWS